MQPITITYAVELTAALIAVIVTTEILVAVTVSHIVGCNQSRRRERRRGFHGRR
jgi:hypothetical protein